MRFRKHFWIPSWVLAQESLTGLVEISMHWDPEDFPRFFYLRHQYMFRQFHPPTWVRLRKLFWVLSGELHCWKSLTWLTLPPCRSRSFFVLFFPHGVFSACGFYFLDGCHASILPNTRNTPQLKPEKYTFIFRRFTVFLSLHWVKN